MKSNMLQAFSSRKVVLSKLISIDPIFKSYLFSKVGGLNLHIWQTSSVSIKLASNTQSEILLCSYIVMLISLDVKIMTLSLLGGSGFHSPFM